MSDGVNSCTFIGTVGKEPEVRLFPNGDAVCNLSIAVNESWKDKSSGEKKTRVEWVPLTFTKKLAEIVGKYVHKGQLIYVSGKLTTRKWQKDGVDRYTTEIQVSEMKMLGGKSESDRGSDVQTTRRPAPQPAPSADDDLDLPFL